MRGAASGRGVFVGACSVEGSVANILGDDRFDLRVSSQNKQNWTLLNLNHDSNVSNDGAFENTTFTLYIDGGDGMNLILGQTIADGAFAGYTLDCKGDKLTFNNIASV